MPPEISMQAVYKPLKVAVLLHEVNCCNTTSCHYASHTGIKKNSMLGPPPPRTCVLCLPLVHLLPLLARRSSHQPPSSALQQHPGQLPSLLQLLPTHQRGRGLRLKHLQQQQQQWYDL
jgi:hypothetical protein